jgi:hypothetical protein
MKTVEVTRGGSAHSSKLWQRQHLEVPQTVAPGEVAPASPVGVVMPEVPPVPRAWVEREIPRIPQDGLEVPPLSAKPATAALRVRREQLGEHVADVQQGAARGCKWALLDSNQGPIGYEPTALTAELRARHSLQRVRSLPPEALKASGTVHAATGIAGWPPCVHLSVRGLCALAEAPPGPPGSAAMPVTSPPGGTPSGAPAGPSCPAPAGPPPGPPP